MKVNVAAATAMVGMMLNTKKGCLEGNWCLVHVFRRLSVGESHTQVPYWEFIGYLDRSTKRF